MNPETLASAEALGDFEARQSEAAHGIFEGVGLGEAQGKGLRRRIPGEERRALHPPGRQDLLRGLRRAQDGVFLLLLLLLLRSLLLLPGLRLLRRLLLLTLRLLGCLFQELGEDVHVRVFRGAVDAAPLRSRGERQKFAIRAQTAPDAVLPPQGSNALRPKEPLWTNPGLGSRGS